MEGSSLNHITDIELTSLQYALEKIKLSEQTELLPESTRKIFGNDDVPF